MSKVTIDGKSVTITGDLAGRDIIKKSENKTTVNLSKNVEELLDLIAKSDVGRTKQIVNDLEYVFQNDLDAFFKNEVARIAREKVSKNTLNIKDSLVFLESISTSAIGSGIVTLITEALKMLL
ncbi:MAG: hypothetical protein ACFFFH_18585 [Candidatus Thorarchaeota archaeon]